MFQLVTTRWQYLTPVEYVRLLHVRCESRRHLKNAGIRPTGSLSLHTLRKCAGQNRADALPPHIIEELMGHFSIATTMKYCSQVEETQRVRAAAIVDELICEA